MQAVLFWEPTAMAPSPVKRSNDVIAGTEFLSVFINGAMAPRPAQRRRGSFRRTGHNHNHHHNNHHSDSISSESKHNEAFIYRISRAPPAARTTTVIQPKASTMTPYRDSDVRYYPISQKALNHSHSLVSLIDDLATVDEITSKLKAREGKRNSTVISKSQKVGKLDNKILDRKVIGVSVTSSVEATPYKIRIEHHPIRNSVKLNSPIPSSTTSSSSIFTSSTSTVEIPNVTSRFVTEDLGNIVSESNRSEFSVDEGSAQTVWQEPSVITSKPYTGNEKSTALEENSDVNDSATSGSSSIPVEVHDYQITSKQVAELIGGSRAHYQGRKVSRHYDGSFYDNNSPSSRRHHNEPIDTIHHKTYSEPEKVYSEPAKVYGEPAKIYSEPSKVYGEPAKVYSEPARIYSEPEKIYSEPARIYSEPAKIYSEPAKVYSEPSKIYDSNGQPPVNSQSMEPVEQNYEVDEAVSVGSNGNVHGPQPVTVATNKADSEDGRKVGYVVEGRNYRKYRVEERTPDGFIVGEYGVVSHDDGSLRGVRYTADGTINPRLIYDALMKFLAL